MSSETLPAPGRPTDEHGFEQRSHREILIVMSGLMITMMLAMLDNMIVAPALPTIVGELGGLEHLAWVTTAYILGTAVSTPIWGKLGDIFSRKAIFVVSILIFLAGSALCGAARSMNELIAFRTFQGIGAGGMIVGVMAVMAVLVPPRDRGRYTGYFMTIMPVAMIAGPLIGGAITDHASWRWAFYVNVPIGAAALVVVATTMRLPPPPKVKVRIDWVGAALMITWVTALILLTTWGGTEHAWGSPVLLALIALTLAGFVAFIAVERRVPDPVLPLRVFGNLNFTLAAALSFVVGFALFGAMTFLPQFQQYVQGASATESGLLLLPLMAGSVISSTLAGQLISRNGHYRTYPILGTAMMGVGLLLLATVEVNSGKTETGIFMFVLGLGMGLLMQITMLIAQSSVPMKDIGAATAAATFLRSMGGSIGVSALGAIYAHQLSGTLQERLGADNPLGSGAELTPEEVRAMPDEVLDGLQHGITDAIVAVFALSAVIAAIGVILALFVRQVPLRGSGPAGSAGPIAQPAGITAPEVLAGVPRVVGAQLPTTFPGASPDAKSDCVFGGRTG